MFTEVISGKIKVFQPLLYVSAYRKKSLTDFIGLGYLFIYMFGFYYCHLLDGMLSWCLLITAWLLFWAGTAVHGSTLQDVSAP